MLMTLDDYFSPVHCQTSDSAFGLFWALGSFKGLSHDLEIRDKEQKLGGSYLK